MMWATVHTAQAQAIVWKLKDTATVGGFKPVVLGTPKAVATKNNQALFFDGVDDGLIIPANPVKGWQRFTIEVLFKPDADGPAAPRFVHFQDSIDNRGTIEARITPDGFWYLDTFLKNGKTGKRLTLIDSTHLHPAGQWQWVALVYDGKKMAHYINGIKEMEGEITLEPMGTGELSLGVRLNRVNWFKGLISEIRFHPEALNKEQVQRL